MTNNFRKFCDIVRLINCELNIAEKKILVVEIEGCFCSRHLFFFFQTFVCLWVIQTDVEELQKVTVRFLARLLRTTTSLKFYRQNL